MDCKSIEHILPVYIEHAASEEEARMVEEHLCVCHTCRARLGNIMDKPIAASRRRAPQMQPEGKKKDSYLFEYIILGLGLVILVFFVFLFIKG